MQRSARGIQRRRRVAGGLVTAVVLAIAVPVALNVTGTPDAGRPVAPATTSPSGTPTPSVTPTPTTAGTPDPSPSLPQPGGVTPLTVASAKNGPPAAISYLRGSTLVAPGAAPVDLPAAYDTVAPYRGGWLAVQRKQGRAYVVHIDASGQVTGSTQGGDRIVTSQDGVELAWVEGDKLYLDGTNGHSDQPQSVALPQGTTSASPVGFVGPGSVVLSAADNAGQKLYVSDFQSLSPLKGVLSVRATDESNATLGVQTSSNGNNGTSCWAVRTNAGGDKEPKTCDWTIESFSTDGAHFVGYPSGIDGLGSASVGLLDSGSAARVVSFERQGNGDTYVADQAWEDESHVLASLHEGDRWYLVRLGLDGSLEKLDEAPGSLDQSPFHFAAHS